MIYYTVYKTVNLLNGKYYFGVHKTTNPNDDYLGSGKYIKRAVAKHGEQNFRKEILFVYLDPESAFGKEDELIQCYRGRDPLCMNLRKGGSGGFDWINKQGLNTLVNNDVVLNQRKSERVKREYAEQVPGALIRLQVLDAHRSKNWDQDRLKAMSKIGAMKWKGCHHSNQSKAKIAKKQRGHKIASLVHFGFLGTGKTERLLVNN